MLWQLFEALSGRLCSSLDRGLNNNTLLPTDKELRRRFFYQEKNNFKNHYQSWNICTCDLTLLKEKIRTRRLNKILVLGATITCFKLSWKLSNNLHCFRPKSYTEYVLFAISANLQQKCSSTLKWHKKKKKIVHFYFHTLLFYNVKHIVCAKITPRVHTITKQMRKSIQKVRKFLCFGWKITLLWKILRTSW